MPGCMKMTFQSRHREACRQASVGGAGGYGNGQTVSIAPSRSLPASRLVGKSFTERHEEFQSRHREACRQAKADPSYRRKQCFVSIAPSRSLPASRMISATSVADINCVSIAPSRSLPASHKISTHSPHLQERFNRAIAKPAGKPHCYTAGNRSAILTFQSRHREACRQAARTQPVHLEFRSKRFNRAIAKPAGKPTRRPVASLGHHKRFNRAIAKPAGKPPRKGSSPIMTSARFNRAIAKPAGKPKRFTDRINRAQHVSIAPSRSLQASPRAIAFYEEYGQDEVSIAPSRSLQASLFCHQSLADSTTNSGCSQAMLALALRRTAA